MSIVIITCDDELFGLLDRDYQHRPTCRVPSDRHIAVVYDWCAEQFGPSAKKYCPVGFQIDLGRSWFCYKWDFYFRDFDEAMWFRFRWG